jgi:hypothetical protein
MDASHQFHFLFVPMLFVFCLAREAKRVHIHRTASWPARDDRRAALVWLAIFWIFVGVGFGFDLHNYLHEQPPVPTFVLDSVVRDVDYPPHCRN